MEKKRDNDNIRKIYTAPLAEVFALGSGALMGDDDAWSAPEDEGGPRIPEGKARSAFEAAGTAEGGDTGLWDNLWE